MSFQIDFTEDAEEWLLRLSPEEFAAVAGALDLLEERGPALGRPAVDTLRGSRHRNMKELRSFGGHLRAIFAFDPYRQAIVLVGGDKRDDWSGWYDRNIPLADDLYDEHLKRRSRR
ncbi:MAG: type II toxin-antitoxin system RelE/ParE family toxin [Conexibacter sp.]